MSDYDDPTDFSTMCRLCLCHNAELVSLYPNDEFHSKTSTNEIVLQMIETFTTVQIHPMDNLPQKVCAVCMQTVESMQAFQNQCKRNDDELRKRYGERDESKNDIKILDTSHSKEIFEILELDKSDTKDIVQLMDVHDTKEMLRANMLDVSLESDRESTIDPDFSIESHKESTSKGNKMKTTQVATKKSNKFPKSRLDGTFACYICGKRYHNYMLEYHINTHKGLRPFSCNIDNCKSTFAAPYDLKTHKRVCHYRKAEFVCDVCGRAFNRKPALRIHLSYHFDAKIPCTICEKKFKNDIALTKHMMVHSQERKFKCETCAKSFQTKYTLRIHKRVHTQEKPYLCYCGVSFAYKCLLKTHTEKYHKEKLAGSS